MNPDLYKALRGGGAGNFGIVTDLELQVHPYEGMWGGRINWVWEQGDLLINAFIDYSLGDNADTSVIFGLINYGGQWLWHCDIEHLKPTRPEKDSVLGRFLDIAPTVRDQARQVSQLERTDDIAGNYPPGAFCGFWTFCTRIDKRIIWRFMETWRREVEPLLHVEVLNQTALANINVASERVMNAMSRNGGNSLGQKGPFLVFLMEPLWMGAEATPLIYAAMRKTAMETQRLASELGLAHNYIYLNYANPLQDVYTSYGREAKGFLEEVSRKYDPEGIFQSQRQAGWHFHGALAPSARDEAVKSRF